MLNYRYVSLAFILISCFFIAGYFWADISLMFLFITVALYLILCFLGSAFICSGFYTKAICRNVHSKAKTVYITFDDSPNEKETLSVLKVLKKHDVKASFFIVGVKAEKNLDMLRRIAEEGHVLGNHSYSHKNVFPLKSKTKIIEEIKKTDSIIKRVKPVEADIFRPPFGVTNPPVAKAIKALKFKTIGWSLKSLDTVIKKKNKILRRLIRKTKPGDIVLLHDSVNDIHIVLDNYIEHLKKNNYNFETVDKLIS